MAEVIRAADLAQEAVNKVEPLSVTLDEWERSGGTAFPYKTLVDFVGEALHAASLLTALTSSLRNYYLGQLAELWEPAFSIGSKTLMPYLRSRWGEIQDEGNVPGPKDIQVWESRVLEVFEHYRLIRRTVKDNALRSQYLAAWSASLQTLEDTWKFKAS